MNPSPDESNLEQGEIKLLEKYIRDSSIQGISINQPIEDAILQARYGAELWKHVLIAVFVLMIAEMLLAREGETFEETGERNRTKERWEKEPSRL